MELSHSPDDRDYANGERPHAASEQPTKIMSPSSPAALTSVAASGHCATCGAALAADQRYCVECGQRRGPLRMPATIGATQQRPPKGKSDEQRRRKPRMSPNATLIAGVGTLMLAMGVGVLIGRQAGGASNNKPVQLVTLPGAGAGTSGTATTEPGGSNTSESTTASKSASAGSSKAKKSVEQVLKGKNLPPKPVVKVGTPGKGPGYQKGHFTGKFFGGAENAKQEEEEEIGE